jgi:exosortase
MGWIVQTISSRNLQFVVFSLILICIFHDFFYQLISFSLSSHISQYRFLIPFISAYFFYTARKKIFSEATYSISLGSSVILAGLGLYLLGREWKTQLDLNDYLCVTTSSVLLIWMGGFILFYGKATLRRGLFPICFSFFLVPIPTGLTEPAIVFLQKSSVDATDWLLRIAGIPVQKDGFVLQFSSLEIEVGEDCSGMRGGLALLVVSVVLGYLFIKAPIRKAVLILSVVPITLIKNVTRIAVISVLANYVTGEILLLKFHSYAFPFFGLAIILLAIVVRVLQKGEQHV